MRTMITRSLQALLSISAVVLLTGAKDAGCGFGETGGGTAGGGTGGSTDPGLVCPDGSEAQWICGDPMPMPCQGPDCAVSNTGCAEPPPVCDCPAPEPCAPGEACPPAPACECPPPPPPCDGTNCPPAPECKLECVPVSNVCPAGFHTETVCSGPVEPPPVDPNDPDKPVPVMGEGTKPGHPGDGTCSEVCVPDDICPPGTVQQTVCSGSTGPADPNDPSMPPKPEDQCWNECVPEAPFCPPGTVEQTVCSGGTAPADPNDPSMPPKPEDQCWTECVPEEPFCPPGTHEEAACPPSDEMGAPCQISCVPDQPPCPPGQHLEEQCDDQSQPATCTLACVDDLPAN